MGNSYRKALVILGLVFCLFLSTQVYAGKIVAWGSNESGQSNAPAGDDFVAVAAGGHHSLALKRNGSIVAWGNNSVGQCTVPSPNTDFVAISAGYHHSLGLKSDGSIVAWGWNEQGQCNVPWPNTEFIAVSGGVEHSLGLKSDGSIVAWGRNGYGQCNVPEPNTDFIAISGGRLGSIGLKSDGSIVAWGNNSMGECDVPLPNTDFVAIEAGYHHSLGLKSDGSIVAWGYNLYGQCDVPLPNTGFMAVVGGGYCSLAIKTDGSVLAWGDNQRGACNVPEPNTEFVAIDSAGYLGAHSLGLKADIVYNLPPIADADGPYTVYVGDTLTLDANGSTDADGDIVSYMWDLDDDGDGVFETDAGGQPIFDVNYTYLESLGLLVNHTYNIHVQVTDSKQQSDVNDSTLTILPKLALVVSVDIKPTSCPNPLNVKSSGVLPVAVLGSEALDVSEIVPTSIQLAGVEAIRNDYEDVATPVLDANDCNCTTDGPDGFLDLTLKFKTQRIVEAIGNVNDGDVLTLPLTGVLFGERPIEGADCVFIRGKHKPFNKADINKDGIVDMLDFAIITDNWLQSSIVED